MTLPYSDAIFVCAFPRECTEAFLEGHVRAFAFFGGVPRRISYDNSRIAVAQITGSRDRKVTDAFLRLKSHHLFEDHFCLVRRPNEKGHVETLIGFARRSFLVPVPAVHGGLEPLNADLERRCRDDLARRPWGKPAAKAELLADERAALLPPPSESFVAARVEPRSVDSLSLVSFDANQYSVPTEFAHHRVTVVASVDTVRIVAGDRVAAVHRRCWGREQVFYDPVHYLAVLERKPGALDFAAPLGGWELPVCFGVLRRRLEAEFGGPGTRQFIKVLRLLERASLGELTRAVERALELGRPTPTPCGRSWSIGASGRSACSASTAGRTSRRSRCRCPTSRPTRAWRRGWHHEEARDHEHGAAEAPPQGAEAADDDGRVREGGGPVPRENVDHLGFLLQLCELELLDRERRAAERRLQAARFPKLKTLDGFDFARPRR